MAIWPNKFHQKYIKSIIFDFVSCQTKIVHKKQKMKNVPTTISNTTLNAVFKYDVVYKLTTFYSTCCDVNVISACVWRNEQLKTKKSSWQKSWQHLVSHTTLSFLVCWNLTKTLLSPYNFTIPVFTLSVHSHSVCAYNNFAFSSESLIKTSLKNAIS
jgi:hypothetical protein